MLTYFYNKSNKGEKDSLTLKIYDGERHIRTLKKKAPKETGFHRWYWPLNEKGVNRPSRSEQKRKTEPGGVRVNPEFTRLYWNIKKDNLKQKLLS